MQDDIKTGLVLAKNAEDAMQRPEAEWPEEVLPGKYRRMAGDTQACLAMAAEMLDTASTGSVKEMAAAVPVANAWMRLGELSVKLGVQK